MDDNPITVFTIPGTKISIDDSLDWLGLGLVSVSCRGSDDIASFEEKFVLFHPDTERAADQLNLRAVGVPKDAKLQYAATMFEATQKEGEDFVRECIALHLLFESKRLGDMLVAILLVTLGRFPDIQEGRFFCTQRSFTSH
jgi:hypothetical protein